jgi:hypothetical protein
MIRHAPYSEGITTYQGSQMTIRATDGAFSTAN